MSNNNFTSFWQSPLWEEILSGTGQAETFWHTNKGQSWLMERRTILGNMTGLYALGVDESGVTPEYLKSLQTIIKKTDIFVQIEPATYSVGNNEEERKIIDPEHPVGELNSDRREKREGLSNISAPFRRFLEPKTAVIPLIGMTEDTLLYRFEEKGRYNIRVAERRGLMTQWVQGDAVSPFDLPRSPGAGKKTNIELFFELLKETTERDDFSHNSLSYYQTFVRTLEQHNSGGLLLSVKDKIVHAAGIFVYHGEQAIYYYGSSPNSPEIRRDHGTYLLQWEAIREALRRNCSEYDFLGISSEVGDKLAGVTAFKMRFAPDKVQLPPETIIVLRPIILMFLKILSRIRKMIR